MRQNMKKVICMAAVGALTLVSVIGDNVTSEAAAKTKKIVMNKKKVTLEAGKSFKLKVKKVKPAKASKKVTYKSNKKKVATVSKKGVIKAKSKGKATITVTAKNNKKAKAKVTVTVEKATKPNNDNKTAAPTTPATAVPSNAPSAPSQVPSVSQPPVSSTAPSNVPSASAPAQVSKAPATQKPTTPPPPPKYTFPAETAKPQIDYDFTDEGSYKNENDSCEYTVNPDKTMTIKFKKQYAAMNFYLPDNAQNYYSDYKSVRIVYSSTYSGTPSTDEGDEGKGHLGYALYDGALDYEGADSSGTETGKHPNWNHPVKNTNGEEKTIVATYEEIPDCVGNCLRGIQIFCPDAVDEQNYITIHIKSITFSTSLVPGVTPPEPETPPTESAKPETPPTGSAKPETSPSESANPGTPSTGAVTLDLSKPSTYVTEGADVKPAYDAAKGVLNVEVPCTQAIIFKVPDDGKKYTKAKVTYSTPDDNVNVYMIDERIKNDGKGQAEADGSDGQHKEANLSAAADTDSTKEYTIKDDYVGGCFKAIKFVYLKWKGSDIVIPSGTTLSIKKIELS